MNILLVDDDQYVLLALQKKIPWSQLGDITLFTANSVQQAQKILTANTIELVISDIEMSQGNGLELLAWVRDQAIDCEFIFLTNYADFNYAQKAISLQSFEYYVKPIEFDKFAFIIKKALTKIIQKKSLPLSQNKRLLWKQSLSITTAPEQSEKNIYHEFLSSDKDYQLLSITYQPSRTPNKEKNINEIYSFWETQQANITFLFTKQNYHQQEIVLLVNSQQANTALFKQEQVAFYDWLQRHFQQFILLASCSFTSQNYLLAICQFNLLKEQSLFEENRLTMCLKTPLVFSPYHFPHSEFKDALKKMRSKDALKLIDGFFQSCEVFGIMPLNYAESLRTTIQQICYALLEEENIELRTLIDHDKLVNRSNQSFFSIEQFKKYILSLCDICVYKIAEKKLNNTPENKIKLFIDENYQEELSREKISELVFLNPDYIGKLFRKRYDISIGNYIIQKRLEKAVELLAQNNLRIQEIASLVGYENYSYFTRIFKQHYQLTPTQFRNQVLA